MKTPLSIQYKKNQLRRGGALMVAVIFFAVTAIYLATYLYLCRNEYTSVARSQTWNNSMVMAEAGVDDALAFINQNANGAVGTLGNWPSSASADGWNVLSNSSPTVYYVSGRSPDSSLGSYTVYITNTVSTSNGPTILSIGTSTWNGDSATFQAGNTTRKILVTTGGYSQGSDGIIAYAGMNFNGNNVTMDSFDSADPNHSEWQTTMLYHGQPYGLYSDSLSYSSNSLPSRTSDVMVATDGSVISVGNANIYGFVDTAPGGSASISHNGSVGDLNWVSASTSGIESGHARDDMNQIFYSKSLPNPATNGWQATWLPVPATLPANAYFKIGGTWTNIAGVWTNVGGTQYQASSSGSVSLPTPGTNGQSVTYSMVITNMVRNTNWVFYSIGQLSGSIFIDAPYTVIYCTNGISYSGQVQFTVNTNCDVTIYTTGGISVSGKATIDNGTDYAKSFSIYDVAGYTNCPLSFSGNGIGSGYLYVPSNSSTFAGGGSSSYGFVGCLFCNSISINGHYTFHFDEVFNKTSAADQYLPTLWQEVQ
jgi:hypothetical protein